MLIIATPGIYWCISANLMIQNTGKMYGTAAISICTSSLVIMLVSLPGVTTVYQGSIEHLRDMSSGVITNTLAKLALFCNIYSLSGVMVACSLPFRVGSINAVSISVLMSAI